MHLDSAFVNQSEHSFPVAMIHRPLNVVFVARDIKVAESVSTCVDFEVSFTILPCYPSVLVIAHHGYQINFDFTYLTFYL
jgi:hypothetical protein